MHTPASDNYPAPHPDLHANDRILTSTPSLCAKIIENMAAGLYIWKMEDLDDPTSFILLVANPAAERITARPTTAMLNQAIQTCFPCIQQVDLDTFARVVRQGQGETGEETYYRDQQSPEQIFAFSAFPLPEHCVGVMFEDITERRQTQLDLEERAQELANLNTMLSQTTALLQRRNEELDQFAYVASHDLKAPLRAIANLSEWLEEDLEGQLPAENRHQLLLLRGRVRRMEALIEGLLEYSRIGRQQLPVEAVNVGELIRDIIDSLAPPPEFQILLAPNLPVLHTERMPLRQVFANLIGNSIKHHHRQDGCVQISVSDRGDYFEFAVTDDGPGIEPQYHEKVFTIFQTLTARDTKESTGIGLSIVRKILQSAGNTIVLESDRGQGSTFRFTWPKAPNSPA
jgi:signal transduction histidine kinase